MNPSLTVFDKSPLDGLESEFQKNYHFGVVCKISFLYRCNFIWNVNNLPWTWTTINHIGVCHLIQIFWAHCQQFFDSFFWHYTFQLIHNLLRFNFIFFGGIFHFFCLCPNCMIRFSNLVAVINLDNLTVIKIVSRFKQQCYTHQTLMNFITMTLLKLYSIQKCKQMLFWRFEATSNFRWHLRD